MANKQFFESWIQKNPSLASGLKYAIARSEGTVTKEGNINYGVLFGGSTISDFSKHPDVVKRGGGYASTAAGAYQFLTPTWNELGLPDFSPKSQDIAMLTKVQERLKPLGGLAAIEKAGGLTPNIIAALAPEWASLPTLSGKSYYGQPVKTYEEVERAFNEGKNKAGETLTTANQPTIATATSDGMQIPGLSLAINIFKGKTKKQKSNKNITLDNPEALAQVFLANAISGLNKENSTDLYDLDNYNIV